MKYIYNILLVPLFLLIALPIKSQNKGSDIIDSLYSAMSQSTKDINQVNIYNDLAKNYYKINPDSGIKYASLSVELSKELESEEGLASAYSFLGINNSVKGNYDEALSNFKSSLKIYEELDDIEGISKQLGYLGIVNMNLSNFTSALDYYQQALELEKEEGNTIRVAKQLGNIGIVYTNLKDYRKAIEYSKRALKLSEKVGNKISISRQLGSVALNYTHLKNFEKALEYYKRALRIDEEENNHKGVAIKLGNIGILFLDSNNYKQAYKYFIKALRKNEEIGSKRGIAINLGNLSEFHYRLSQDSIVNNKKFNKEGLNLNKRYNLNKALEYGTKAAELGSSIGAKRQLIEIYHILDKANEYMGNYELAYNYQTEWAALKDSIFSIEKTTEIANLESNKENEIKEKELKVKDLKLQRKDNEQNALILGLLAFIVVIFIIVFQRRKSEKLLLNILPEKIAKRLKRNEKNIADRFDNVSIIFVDIVGFTTYSRSTEPEQIVSALNDIFTRFDMLSIKHGLEKIKTIGDCYMAVAGLPEPNTKHAHSTALFALEAKDIMHNYVTPDGEKLLFRIGIDSGPVVAGVIGESKFSYDLWGDAVNTASRMESTGLPNEIQVTEQFLTLIEGKGIKFEERDEIEVKGKGMVKTYLLK